MLISLLDYGAGNVRSVRNAVRTLGFSLREIRTPNDLSRAEVVLFPGVGNFGSAMGRLQARGLFDALRAYLQADRPFLGICIGLQALFEGSEEAPDIPGLGIIPGRIRRFQAPGHSVPHMGWNGIRSRVPTSPLADYQRDKLYFVHSYRAVPEANNRDWILGETDYGGPFISAVQKGRVAAFQFHPEKSGPRGLDLLEAFLRPDRTSSPRAIEAPSRETRLAKRIIACLDVRTNDAGDLVVTKGDQYDVREAGRVRNLGKPVDLARRYYEEGADEITFLNITAFRDFPLADQPMLEVLRRTSEQVFVPLTIGGGIRAFTDARGRRYSALDVADEYFSSGADKISIGSDAVLTAEQVLNGQHAEGTSAIEQIARRYGNQAVVISIDPRRVYVRDPGDTPHPTVPTRIPGPEGEAYCWFQCTIKGGREGRDLDAVQLARTCETLGAGEILLNSIDRDGTGAGFDLELIRTVKSAVRIPVIASSGAGRVEHFLELFREVDVDAALAAGIFHRREVPIAAVKEALAARGIAVRHAPLLSRSHEL